MVKTVCYRRHPQPAWPARWPMPWTSTNHWHPCVKMLNSLSPREEIGITAWRRSPLSCWRHRPEINMSSLANASLHWPVLMAKLDLGMINGGNGNMDRRDSLLALVDCDEECGLEIGPLDKAIVVRKPGRRIFYCDYARREDLQSRSSSDPNVDIDNIPDIDFVASRITGETFGSRRFDYVIA